MAKIIPFTKGHGTGNDFVLIYDADNSLDLKIGQVAKLCDRNFGIGADGFIRVIESRLVPEASELLKENPEAKWFMDYRNADGSKAEMCGNGIRVFARYLIEKGLATIANGETLTVATRAGVRDVQPNRAGFAVDMGRWKLGEEITVHASKLPVGRLGQGINVGNPHVVVALASKEELATLDLHAAPRLEPSLESGANVEFVVPADPMVVDGVGSIEMRVFERGVGETLSCGTGIVAAALATRHWAGSGAPSIWSVTVPGGTLGVRMFATEEGEHVGLSGAAELVFDGEIDAETFF